MRRRRLDKSGRAVVGVPADRRRRDLAIDTQVAEVPARAWQWGWAGAGAHGLRLYDWARSQLLAGFDPGWARWVLGRRTIPRTPGEDPELAYYVCAGPAATSLEQVVAVAGSRWRIEECLAAAKNEAGLASYQVREYTAWYRHKPAPPTTAVEDRHRHDCRCSKYYRGFAPARPGVSSLLGWWAGSGRWVTVPGGPL